ncbi:MAG: hypothetical protein ACD_70C00131G0003 [uncultured bacterium]|nr:MAG: hypothetical protein ACD_70C00131G0003 [uncultured bacterium]
MTTEARGERSGASAYEKPRKHARSVAEQVRNTMQTFTYIFSETLSLLSSTTPTTPRRRKR